MSPKFYIVVNHFNNYRFAVNVDKSCGKIWIPVSRHDRLYGNAANVSMFSQPLIDFCRKHDISYSVKDENGTTFKFFKGC